MSNRPYNYRITRTGLWLSLFWLFIAGVAGAQTTAFTYQGKLTDNGNPANGTYDLQFKLFDLASGGAQQGATITQSPVAVTNGIFIVQLNFGACSTCFNGSTRFLEIGVRPAGSPNPYTILAPRQQVTSTPYAIRSSAAATSDNASQLGGIAVGGFIHNTSSQQASTNFNVSGNGTLGGTLSANTVDAMTQYNLGGNRALSIAGTNNIFAGIGAGQVNTTGGSNAFFGRGAGANNTTASNNSFFGTSAGFSNTTGFENSFFGNFAGNANTAGGFNSFFGSFAGSANTTGNDNSFFGRDSGVANTTGNDNSFFGAQSGKANTTGFSNSFFGRGAGFSNTTGASNSFFGRDAGKANTIGIENSFFGRDAGFSNAAGSRNSFFGDDAGRLNTTGNNNSFFGTSAGTLNTTGDDNSFFGRNAGLSNTTGSENSFFGANAGNLTTTGNSNSFFGLNAGLANTTGSANACFGTAAGSNNTAGAQNSFFGTGAGFSNTMGNENSFFGVGAGILSATGNENAFFGSGAGSANSSGSGNTFVGNNAGGSNTTENNNTFVGSNSNGAADITNATAIGANAVVTQSDSLVLGAAVNVGIGTTTPLSPLHILGPALDPPSSLSAAQNGMLLGTQGTSGYKWIQTYGGALVLNLRGNNVGIGISTPAFPLDVAGAAHASSFPTSSDARLKTNLSQLTHVLERIEKIRGISFDWNRVYESLGRATGHREIGVVAQEVEAVFPELVTHWGTQGYRAVDYGRLTAVLVEAVKELRAEKEAQVERLKAENAALQKQNETLDFRISAVERRMNNLKRNRQRHRTSIVKKQK